MDLDDLARAVQEPQKHTVTETDLYAIGMESETGWRVMPALCAALGFPFPPENKGEK